MTYLRNVLPRLASLESELRFIALVPRELTTDYRGVVGDRIEIMTVLTGGALGRLWWEQTGLRSMITSRQVDLLIALGNFALFASPVPQVLFNRNDLYFSGDFERDLRARGLYHEVFGNWLKRWLSLRSIAAADVNVTPTHAFAERLASVSGRASNGFEVIPFGFDPEVFNSDQTPLSADQLGKLRIEHPFRRLLYVSHYNYFRNFETLIRALPHCPEDMQLVLTTDIHEGAVYGGYQATAAARLIDELGVRDRIAMLGPVPYGRLHHLYQLCEAFVCPSYSESFGHPLVEAMASGLPVIAANLPVHREICGEAAVYFETFDERALAHACARVLSDRPLAEKLRAEGSERCKSFSWDKHVDELVKLIRRCLDSRLN